jgi:hypothetical protein
MQLHKATRGFFFCRTCFYGSNRNLEQMILNLWVTRQVSALFAFNKNTAAPEVSMLIRAKF